MARITIAELDIDVQAIIASTSQVKKSIDELKAKQTELARAGDTNSAEFVQNAADLRALNSEYTAGVRAIAANTTAIADQANRTQLLSLALQGEATSIAEARAQNRLLNQLRNEANTTTEEGREEILRLNGALDRNNDYIRENADQYLQQRINIGNYSGSIRDALQNLNPFNGGIAGISQRMQDAGGAGNLLRTSFQTLTTSVFGLVKSLLALALTPVGAIIVIIGGAALILYNVFKSFTPIVDKVEQGFAALSAVLNVVKTTIVAVTTGAKNLGSVFSGLGSEMKKAAAEAVAFTKAQQDLDDALEKQEITSARNRAEIDKLNTLAKDKTKTDAQRIALLKQAEELETKDYNQRLTNAKEEERITLQKIKSAAKLNDAEYKQLVKSGFDYKETAEAKGVAADELFTKLKENQVKLAGLDQQYNVNLEKGINKQNKLLEDAEADKEKAQAAAQANREKAQAAAEKAVDDSISKSKTEVEFFIASQGIKAKSLEDSLKLAETVRDKKLAILKTELEKGKITQSEYNLQALNEKNVFLQKQGEITVANADQEVKNFIDANKSKLDANKFLTDELFNQEVSILTSIEAAQKEAERVRYANGLVNKQAYNDSIKAIEEKSQADQKAILDARTVADLEKNAIDKENKIALMDSEFEQRQADLDRARQQEIDSAEKTGADVQLINEKYIKFQKEIDLQVQKSKLEAISQTLGSAAALFKENTLAYKALSIAQITIDTILSAQGAYKAMIGIPVVGPTLAPIAAGIAYASGAMNAAKVAGVKFENGGIQEVGGNRHAQGGTKFYGEDGTTFEAERGEGIGVLNRGAFASFMDFNNSHGGGKSTPTFMSGGGIITQGVQSQSNGMNADDILNIIKSIPAPVVAVTDIHNASDNYARVVNGADF